MISIALPKGRMGQAAYEVLARAGFAAVDREASDRKLVFQNAEGTVRYFLVKPSDTAVYVQRGVADIGIAGRDILLETEPDVYELADLGFGACHLAVAAPKAFVDDPALPLRVATTYPHCTREYYMRTGRDIELILLHGSVELAPILGLSDVIVDIVETGTTLRENGLEVRQRIAQSSARLIANKSSYLFKRAEIDALVEKMEEAR